MATPKKSPQLAQQVAVINATLAHGGVKLQLQGSRLVSTTELHKVYLVSFTNPMGVQVEFTTEAAKASMAQFHLAGLPPQLTGKKYAVKEVAAPKALHFTHAELMELHTLATPGVHWYLGQPEEYKAARKQYEAIDPLGRYMRLYGEAERQARTELMARAD